MPRVALSIVEARRRQLVELLGARRYLPVHEVARELNVSEATARRDLDALQLQDRARRTFGGAVQPVEPDAALPDFDRRFPSFARRLRDAWPAKKRIARAAFKLIGAGQTLFLDAGTTCYAVARLLAGGKVRVPTGLRVYTHSLVLAEQLAAAEAVDVRMLGGRLLHNQRICLGAEVLRQVRRLRFDLALLGGEGFDAAGVWGSHAQVVQLQQAVVGRCDRHVLLLDGTKLNQNHGRLLLAWPDADTLITDATATDLKHAGVPRTPPRHVKA
ncbi:MAG: DeoR/GlpR family DNA-binding transcription regulator [Phycisphaerae bacterium]